MAGYESWLSQARQYVDNGKTLSGTDDHEAMVQLEQAAEYALKAVQVAREGSSRDTHNVVGLAHEVGAPSRFHTSLADLQQAYDRRYPDDPDFEDVDAESPLSYVSDIQDLIAWAENECIDASDP